ncbi:cyclase family protein [Methanococcoides sp. SA1]|nr:cyclase family protein [Methanococcoides sp. SA1]
MKYKLLSYPINTETPTYGDNPPLDITPYSRIANGDSSNTSTLTVHNHTGTHIDAPNHFVNDGKTIIEYSPEELIFKEVVIIDCFKTGATLITMDDLELHSSKLQKADCVLIRTGFWKCRTQTKYKTRNPGISPEAILWIRQFYANIRCIGIDSISISSYQHREIGRNAHKAAFIKNDDLGEPLLLIEDLNLDIDITSKIKTLFVNPWQIEIIDSVPCSVLAKLV